MDSPAHSGFIQQPSLVMVQVFRDCDPNQVEGWVQDLEEQSQISPLWEVLFQLMCHPVPQVTNAFSARLHQTPEMCHPASDAAHLQHLRLAHHCFLVYAVRLQLGV